MSTAAEAFEALAAAHATTPGAGRRAMFGRDTLTVDGHICAFRDTEELALRLPPDAAAALLASGEAEVPVMGARSMDGWVAVSLATDRSAVLDAAREHVRELFAATGRESPARAPRRR